MSLVLDALVCAVSWAHVLLAPYTKVEESFNLHAVHDILFHGVQRDALEKYDHKIFPGAVPRSFIGSILLSWLSNHAIKLANDLSLITTKFDLQIVIRLVLASVNAQGLCLLRRAVSRRFGRPTSLLFTLITVTQFHLPFWMGRTLPNMLALPFVNLSFYLLLNREKNATRTSPRGASWAIASLTFAAVVLRAEIAGLLAMVALQLLFERSLSLARLIKVGIVAGLVSVALTVCIDSYFWGEWPLWPELSSVYFNVYQGKSAEWGVSPPWTYFTSSLPRLLMATGLLVPIGFVADARIRSFALPALGFVLLVSGLAHKEWRFVVYVVPPLNVAAAQGARYLVGKRKGTILGRLAFLLVAGLLLANASASVLLSHTSRANYSGGAALSALNTRYAGAPPVHVHIANLAAQSGASLFLQTHAPPFRGALGVRPLTPGAPWVYNKTENLTPADIAYDTSFTHVIAESEDALPHGKWQAVEAVHGYKRWNVRKDVLKLVREEGFQGLSGVLEMETEGKLWVFERRI
ncbi:Alg9-like mannosyltransferase family-domain-containing protein [Gloeopeniophorella convolvens]|nr:Alg9-like mannosyltransferase family-domain-containing protein [Gloeopeniophorella convolvens]